MSMIRIYAIMLRQFYLMRGSFTRVVPLFLWVAIDVTLWGFITKYLNSVQLQGLNFVPSLLGAVLLWDFFARVMQGMAMAFFEDVWSRNFLNFFATPLRTSEYLLGLIFTSMATSAFGLAVMLAIAVGGFGLKLAIFGFLLFPFFLCLFLFGVALGILGVSVVIRLGPAAEWFVWPIPIMLAPFAGVFYPISTLPSWMQSVSRLLPPSYIFEGMRTIVHGGSMNLQLLGTSLALSLLHILIAALFFAATFKKAVRTGLLARYSAESVN